MVAGTCATAPMPTSGHANVAARVRSKRNAPAEHSAILPSTWTSQPGNVRELASTPEFATAQRQRKKVEALFAQLKNQIGLRRVRLRRLKFVREQFFLAAAAQNIKRLVRFLSHPTTPVLKATT